MIIEALLALFRGLATAILGLLPEQTVESYELSGFTLPGGIVDAIFPWSHFSTAVVVLLAWTLVCHGYRIVLWVLGLIHVAGSVGG